MLPVQGFNKGESLADIGEIPQAQRKQQISEAGTVKMPLRADTIREADAPPPVPGAQVGHSRKRTVSHEDYLTGRGANPRTGIISPSISSSSNTSDDHLSHRELLNHWNTQMSKKWRLKGDQWISLGKDEKTPLPSPSSKKSSIDPDIDAEEKVRSYIRRFHRRGVPLSQVEDRFVVHMPSAREPCPPTMTGEQILEFQKAIDKLYKTASAPWIQFPCFLHNLTKKAKDLQDEMHSVTERDHHVDAFDGRNPFLGVAAKGTELQEPDEPRYPSPLWMTTLPIQRKPVQNQYWSTGTMQMESVVLAQHAHLTTFPKELLKKGEIADVPAAKACPQLNQGAASTTTTTMPQMLQFPTLNRNRVGDANLNAALSLAKERRQLCASVSPISLNLNANIGNVDCVKDNKHNMESNGWNPTIGIQASEPIHPLTDSNHGSDPRNSSFFHSQMQVSCIQWRPNCSIGSSIFPRPRERHLNTPTPKIIQQWINLFSFVLALYLIRAVFIFIVSFGTYTSR
ncbi:hypothetical protein LOZ51_000544 [Ophidiomyces ophidiicola]|nr:hypothetical protein LOZ55_001566 [Ophidiomyces ophidiicola]KAI1988537.1 hypothetical protein LOZ54_003141 [Ophidiomyces ophidiicola]KAI2003464.1 hypothetical protein LOZ51_000544 [Ophidiomyces ophidiicola]